jgi:hypothetical protein
MWWLIEEFLIRKLLPARRRQVGVGVINLWGMYARAYFQYLLTCCLTFFPANVAMGKCFLRKLNILASVAMTAAGYRQCERRIRKSNVVT